MTNISEYGDVMINAYMDEWGRRRTDSLLEDGVKIMGMIGIILKQWSQIGITSHVFSRPYCYIRLTQVSRALHVWTVEYPALILKKWLATLQATYVFNRPARIIRLPTVLQLNHVFSRSSRLIYLFERLRLLHEFYAAKPAAKKTKLFLVMGDLAIQLSND